MCEEEELVAAEYRKCVESLKTAKTEGKIVASDLTTATGKLESWFTALREGATSEVEELLEHIAFEILSKNTQAEGQAVEEKKKQLEHILLIIGSIDPDGDRPALNKEKKRVLAEKKALNQAAAASSLQRVAETWGGNVDELDIVMAELDRAKGARLHADLAQALCELRAL